MRAKDEIQKELNSYFERLIAAYGEKRILGVWTQGSINYDPEGEVTYVAVYIPDYEELCTVKPYKEVSEKLIIKDIRDFFLSEHNSIDLLYAYAYRVNRLYQKYFQKYFFDNRKEFKTDHRDFHKKIKMSKAEFEKEDYDSAADLKKRAYGVLRETPYKEGCLAIMDIALNDKPSLEEFKELLTKTELRALSEIENRLEDGTVVISISKITEETGISRPVFKNLLSKLEIENIAKIVNMGVKGTQITFH